MLLGGKVIYRNMAKVATQQRPSKFMQEQYVKLEHAEKSANLWKKLTYFVAFPTILVLMAKTYYQELKEHHKPRPEFIPYPHLRIRHKDFPWGDGNHSFFHNPVKNALPDGYETEDPNADAGKKNH